MFVRDMRLYSALTKEVGMAITKARRHLSAGKLNLPGLSTF